MAAAVGIRVGDRTWPSAAVHSALRDAPNCQAIMPCVNTVYFIYDECYNLEYSSSTIQRNMLPPTAGRRVTEEMIQ
jgi:hypothetical protein